MGQNENNNPESNSSASRLPTNGQIVPLSKYGSLALLITCVLIGVFALGLLIASAVQLVYLLGLEAIILVLLASILLVSQRYTSLRQKYNVMSRQTLLMSRKLESLEYKCSSAQKLGLNLTAESHNLNTTIRKNVADIKLETASVTNIISFVEEMNHNSQSISGETVQLSHTSEEIKSSSSWVKAKFGEVMDTGEKGAIAVERTIAGNREVGELYNSLRKTLNELAQRQSQIRDVVTLIKEISNETHLLSLNATIEAAGAGPYGERFSVIANEVRSLAKRVLLSSGEVNQKLGEIEDRIKTAASAAETGQKVTGMSLEMALECGSVIGDLVVSIYQFSEESEKIEQVAENLNTRVNTILAASTQQSATSNQAVETLRAIGAMTAQNTENSLALNSGLNKLEGLFQELVHTLKPD